MTMHFLSGMFEKLRIGETGFSSFKALQIKGWLLIIKGETLSLWLCWVITEQLPVPALHGFLLMRSAKSHVISMRNAMAVSNDYRSSGECGCLLNGTNGMHIICRHCNLCHISRAMRNCL